jgi:hypothetical protein
MNSSCLALAFITFILYQLQVSYWQIDFLHKIEIRESVFSKGLSALCTYVVLGTELDC